MFHMTFPYGEACDSEQYSIRPQVSPERDGITHKNWDIKRGGRMDCSTCERVLGYIEAHIREKIRL